MGKPTHRPYDLEFRTRAVELARTSGLPRAQVARATWAANFALVGQAGRY